MIDSTQGQELAQRPSLVLPNGEVATTREQFGAGDSVMIVNDTGLPDHLIEDSVADTFVENASLAWGRETTFQTYAQQGSMLARSAYSTPANIIDEIKLARELAERDDDVAAVLGQMVAIAFGDGMENHHSDEKTVALFNEICRNCDMDMALQELYRELLISAQINLTTLFTREQLEYSLTGSEVLNQQSVASPLVGVLPAENIRIIGNDMFRTGLLAYAPDNEKLRAWLEKYFADRTSAAEKAAMGRADRVSANMFTGKVSVSISEQLDISELPSWGGELYLLNPRMVSRTTFPKGSAKYPRPLLTRNLALLEAKRLLNIMDYALLQGGSNYIVVAKKGTDQHPAKGGEVENLGNVVRRASKTGVIVGDHRLSFDVITPELKELLNPEKRRLLGRKIVMSMLRLSEHGNEEGGAEGMKSDDEVVARVITSDRKIVQRIVEKSVYRETAKRNPKVFKKGAADMWFPKIILQGTQFFTDYILKLRDRGDIPRSWAVAAAGFQWNAAVAERRREVSAGDDDVMQPGSVPHSSPEAGPQDNNEGRPKGAKGGSRQDPAKPKRTIGQNPGETVRAWFEPEVDDVVRMGEITCAILEDHPDRIVGRVTKTERAVLDSGQITQRGQTLHVPVNEEYETKDEKAVRLRDGLSMIVGNRKTDGAIVAKLLSFRDPDFSENEAEELAIRWGFLPTGIEGRPAPVRIAPEEHALLPSSQPVELHVHYGTPDDPAKRVRVLRDKDGNVIGTEEFAALDSLGVFDLSAMDPAGRAVVESAVSRCSFDFTRLLPQMKSEGGITAIKVRWAALDKGVLAETPLLEGATEEAADEVLISQAIKDKPDDAAEAFLSECAHLVDFYLLSTANRREVVDAFPNLGTPERDSWFEGAEYWEQVGEAFMNAFMLAYSDFTPDQSKFTHKADAGVVQRVKQIIESA